MSAPFKGRREDARLLTGRGLYTSDWSLPDQLHAVFLRADRAHADIVSIDTRNARAAPGIQAVYTGADLAREGYKAAPPLLRAPGRGGMPLKVPQRHLLAVDRVRFVGEEVAMVVARTAREAQDAAELIEVEYRDLPVVTGAAQALAAGAVQLHEGIPGNLCYDFEYGDAAQADAAFSRAAHVTTVTVEAQRIAGNPMEPKACLAAWDPATQSYDVYSPSQGMSMMAAGLAGVMGVPEERIRCHARDVGGGFGIRSEPYAEYGAVMHAAKALRRPVKWVSSRSETFLTDAHGRGAVLSGELALDRDGRFIGLRVQWLVNCGAYLSVPGPLINTLAPSVHAVNTYRIPALYGRHLLALTNTMATIAYRGAGRPNVTYLVERLVDEAARELRIDRIELRRRNVIGRDEFPYRTPVGSVYDSGDPAGELERAVEYSAWRDFEARRDEAKRRGRLRGIGCALFVEPSGGGASAKEEAAIKFGESGNALVYALAGPSGQGHETVFPDILGEALGMAPERFTFQAGDPTGPRLVGEGTVGSRSLMSHGSAMIMAAKEVVRKGMQLAARELEVSSGDLEFQAGRYRVRGTDLSIALEDLIRKHAGAKEHPLDSVGETALPRAFPGGAHVAEVEIDPETGVAEIVGYVAVDDCGRVYNHTLVEGQLHGGIAQGLGQVMGEQCVYDAATGQLVTGTFMDYEMPRADGMPPLALYDHPVPSPSNPLGAKGAGEAGTTGAVPALANAFMDALRPLGIHHLEQPYTPDRLWRAIRSADAAR